MANILWADKAKVRFLLRKKIEFLSWRMTFFGDNIAEI